MKTKTTHTPGPWIVGTKGAGMSIERNPTGEYPVAQWVYNPADAALIAAAPDLLAFLKDKAHIFQGKAATGKDYADFLAVIAKAEGK